ncbi:hypothetical protein [Oryzihumus leptocrescens]|uniref:Uncharacterized protein n=1 Tax=Oryzihumus leptocrescens TaxID=297536 RepID=A0A542ZHZ4_9MICO|nr:hypothetical protein [Oryzihumus leptocrescens]TQL59954.1 hypothetical protein FB474_1329 [Oryzihumus leptocrescens]
MPEEHRLLSNSLLSNGELLVELARVRRELELGRCHATEPGVAHCDAEAPGQECACARMAELEREVELRLTARMDVTPVRPHRGRVARAG